MANERQPIHFLKSRNSDFLAGVDLEIFELEGRSKILTIKDVQYKENFMVNGKKKPSGIVLYFEENYAKPWIINPTERREVKKQTGVIDAAKWIGFSLELFFNMKTSMRVSKTETIKGGISVKRVNTNGLVPPLKDIETRITETKTKVELMAIWNELNESEQIKYKNSFTEKIKTL